MSVEAKNEIGQKVDGSPAQIWAGLELLAIEIFGSTHSARSFAKRFEEINGTAASSAGVPELPGFESPAAECARFLTHNTTQHTAQ